MAQLKKANVEAPNTAVKEEPTPKSAEKEVEAFHETEERLDAEELRTNLNEVLADEDGVVRNETMIAGFEYNGERYDHFSYREMDGRDEAAIEKPECKQNGAKMVNVLCERCIVEFSGETGTITKKELGVAEWSKVIRSVLSNDLDYCVMKIRVLSKGNTLQVRHECPYCKAKLTSVIDFSEFEIKPFKGLYSVPFSLPSRGYLDAKGERHKEGELLMMTSGDREIIFPQFKKNLAVAKSVILARIMRFNDDTPVFKDRVEEMTTRDRDYLNGLLEENAFGVDTNVDIDCSQCGESVTTSVGMNNFF